MKRSIHLSLNKHLLRFALVCGALACLALAGCTTVSTNASAGGGGASPTVTPNDNSLRYALTTEPTTLDPATVEDGTTIDLLQQIYEGLVKWDDKNNIVPALAEKWDLSVDGKTYTFHLKHGVKFHNGREMTADDFKYSIERACDPKTKSTTSGTYLKDIVGAEDRILGKPGATEVSGVKVVDPYTLQITLDAFKPYWLGNMTYPTGYAVCKEEIEKTGGLVTEHSAIGTGPFKMAEYSVSQRVVLAANPDYHNGKPKLDYIVRPVLIDGNTRLNNYIADQLDIVDVSPRDLDQVNGDPKLKADLKAFPRSATWYLALNQDAPGSPFTKKEVRQAFAMAINKPELIKLALRNEADVADGVVPPGMAGYNFKINPIPFDPSRAKEILAKAGYPNGAGFPALTLSFRQDQPQVGETAQVIANQLKTNLGIEIQMRPMEWGQFLKERTAKTMPLSHLRWGADYLDPQDFLSVLLHSSKKVNGQEDHPENGVGYNNPEFDRLCDQADVEHNSTKRMEMYHQAEQIAVNDAPWVPLYFQRDLELVKPRVKNLKDSLLGHLPHVTTTVKE